MNNCITPALHVAVFRCFTIESAHAPAQRSVVPLLWRYACGLWHQRRWWDGWTDLCPPPHSLRTPASPPPSSHCPPAPGSSQTDAGRSDPTAETHKQSAYKKRNLSEVKMSDSPAARVRFVAPEGLRSLYSWLFPHWDAQTRHKPSLPRRCVTQRYTPDPG